MSKKQSTPVPVTRDIDNCKLGRTAGLTPPTSLQPRPTPPPPPPPKIK